MIAGGTGITPLIQIIQASINTTDSLEISLIYGSQSEDDILLKKELEDLQAKDPNRFKMHLLIDKAKNPDNWKGDTGYISKELV